MVPLIYKPLLKAVLCIKYNETIGFISLKNSVYQSPKKAWQFSGLFSGIISEKKERKKPAWQLDLQKSTDQLYKGNRTITDLRYGGKNIISPSKQIFTPIKG